MGGGEIEGMQTWLEAMTSQSRAICYPAWLKRVEKEITDIYLRNTLEVR
jgi:hypothetical protein